MEYFKRQVPRDAVVGTDDTRVTFNPPVRVTGWIGAPCLIGTNTGLRLGEVQPTTSRPLPGQP